MEGGRKERNFWFQIKVQMLHCRRGVEFYIKIHREHSGLLQREPPPPPPLNKIQLNMKKGQKYPKNCKIYLQMLDVKPSNRTYIQFCNYQ